MDRSDFKPTRADGSPDVGPEIALDYTNYRRETARRRISIVGVWFGTTEHHPNRPRYLLHCYDWDKQDWLDYALEDCNFAPCSREG